MSDLNQILMDFGAFAMEATLFDSQIADRFYENLPYSVQLTSWGDELYGTIGIDLGSEKPVSQIPSGGIAYTNQGNLVCIFFGQNPAWPVEHIGGIDNDKWLMLKGKSKLSSVRINKR